MTKQNNYPTMHDPECIFCKIASGSLGTEFIYEDERVVAFHDMNPQAKQHVLLIPKNHYPSVLDLAQQAAHDSDTAADWAALLAAVPQVKERLGIADEGFRLINNCGEGAGQSVFHVHLHVLSDEKLQERLV